jgi:Amino acid:DNA transferase
VKIVDAGFEDPDTGEYVSIAPDDPEKLPEIAPEDTGEQRRDTEDPEADTESEELAEGPENEPEASVAVAPARLEFGARPLDADARRVDGQLWDDFVSFSRLQLSTGDNDPAYPVLRILQADMGREQSIWHTLLYVAFYNIASATEAFAYVNWPNVLPDDLATLPTATERRGLRGGAPLNRHLASIVEIVEQHGSLVAWLTSSIPDGAELTMEQREEAYRIIRDVKLREPWGNGRWAAYKTAEILEKVNDMPLTATDMGNDESTGPRKGLELLYGKVQGSGAEAIEQLDTLGAETMMRLNAELLLNNQRVEIDEVETLLCDFHALAEGHYYVGHDIDQMYEQLKRHEEIRSGQFLFPVWRARSQVFPLRYLAERAEYAGVDRDRMKAYQQLGAIVTR